MKKVLLFLLITVTTLTVCAQNNQLNLKSKKEVDPIKFASKSINSYQLKVSFDKLNWKTKKIKSGDSFTEIWIDKSNSVGDIGTPQLPAYKKLILLPYGATASVKVKNYTQSEYTLQQIGIENQIMPVQPSLRKDEDSTKIIFQLKKEAYQKQGYISNSVAKVEILGNLRSFTIARVTVTPVDYNPSKQSIKVFNDIEVDINISNGTKSASDIKSFSSPYFDFLANSMLNTTESVYDQHPDLTKYPVKMLIISHRMFETSLTPFIQWKTQKGIKVITAYTDVIGTSASQIKAYIQQQYSSATPEDPAPTFLVLVGDVQQVASSQVGNQSERQTDLYYASTDGDMFPEMYYGRMSATTTQQLDNIINKILYYEKYHFSSPQYLNRVTLIAGEDSDWNPRVGQPTVKYGTANYFNASKGYTTVNEFGVASDPNNPLAQSGYAGCYDADKISVGFITYTAHCSETSWAGPTLSISAVNAFTNQYQYPLAIANCCLSADFGSTESIGEAWIRAQNKGAVTYIGSSDYSYWLEDMYWAVGAYPMVGNNNGYVPTFAETTTGAYDAGFVSNYRTTGAMVFAGNLAVTEVEIKDYPNQINATYYWEAYNVLGDPSLMPYFTSAENNSVSHESTAPVGVTTIKIGALKDSYVSINKGSEILGTAYFNQTQEIEVPIQTVNEPCKLGVTITRPQTIPYIDTIETIVVSGPYLTLNSMSINDSEGNNNGKIDFGEQIKVTLVVKNVGLTEATNTRVLLTNHAGNATLISNDSVSFDNIPAGTDNTLALDDVFTFEIAENVADKTTEKFAITFKSDQGTWTSSINLLINAPKLAGGELTIDDSAIGNNNGLANEGESFYTLIPISNTGGSMVADLQISASIPDTLRDIITLNYEPSNSIEINAGETFNFKPRFSIKPNINASRIIPITVKLYSESNSTLNGEFFRSFTIESNSIIKMKNQSVTTCYAIFTDSGGESANYSDGESSITTISSENDYSKIKISFSQFSLEAGYDYLYIYDGENTDAKQVSGSPFHGTTIPSDISSSGKSLTFKFTSDGNTTKPGWNATITCVEPTQIPLCLTNPYPVNNSTNITTDKLSWGASSDAQFYDVYIGYNADNLAYLGRVTEPRIAVDLEKNRTYYWRVIPGNYLGICDKSCEVWNFQTSTNLGEVIMTNGNMVIDSTWFYDSGGSTNSYKDYENYTLTFTPKIPGTKVKVVFDQFDVESNTSCSYDYLNIYDGPTTTSALIGKYCGTTIPSSYTSTSANGELTFQFKSDEGVVKPGWKAKITSVGTVTLYTLTVSVKENDTPISNASVTVNGLVKLTGSNGEAQFSVPSGNFNYSVNALGYIAIANSSTNSGNNQTLTVSLTKQANISIKVLDKQSNEGIHGAKVTINGQSFYTSPEGIALVSSLFGTQNIAIEKIGYYYINSQVNVTTQNEIHVFELDAGLYNIIAFVKDSKGYPLSSAKIEVNGENVQTNSSGFAILQVPYGNHKFSVSKEKYLPIEQWYSIVGDSDINFTMDTIYSDLSNITFLVTTSNGANFLPADDAQIYIYFGDLTYKLLSTSSQGITETTLPVANYKYKVEKAGFLPSDLVSISITAPSYEFKDTLNPTSYTITFNVSSKGSPIEGASVNLSGYNPTITNAQGVAVFSNIVYAKGLTFTVQKEDFYGYTSSEDITSNKTINVNLISTGIEETIKSNLKIYPNPVKDNLSVDSDLPIDKIQIIGITGIVLVNKEGYGVNKTDIPLTNLSRGTYIVRVVYKNGKIDHAKLIKI